MATDFERPITPDDAADTLAQLQTDRSALSRRRRTPLPVAIGFGLVAGAFVCRPALTSDVLDTAIWAVGLVTALALVAVYIRTTGVKGRRTTVRQWLVLTAAVALCWLLLSTSFALVSLDLTGWVLATTLAAVLGVTAVVALPGTRR